VPGVRGEMLVPGDTDDDEFDAHSLTDGHGAEESGTSLV